MITGSLEVSGLEILQRNIDYIKKLKQMLVDKKFQEFIQEKCMEIIKKVADERLNASTVTNQEEIGAYNNNHKIRDITDKGFVIYNDYTIIKPETHHSPSYPFSVALAFEYGTGIIGASNSNAPSWYAYNVNDNHVTIDGEQIDGWWLDANLNNGNPIFGTSKSGKAVVTRGYEGLEIYRFSAIEIQKQLPNWVKEYFRRY